MKVRAVCETAGSWHYIYEEQEVVNTDITCSEHPDSTIRDFIIISIEGSFDVEVFLHRFGDEFSALERLQLSKLAPSFVTELQYENFAEIKMLRDYLVSQEQISQEQSERLTALFAEQNIDLDSLGNTGV